MTRRILQTKSRRAPGLRTSTISLLPIFVHFIQLVGPDSADISKGNHRSKNFAQGNTGPIVTKRVTCRLMARKKEFESEDIVEKAIEIFWQNGYKKTSMQALLDHLELGRGSFYNAFESKHALFLLALDRYSVLMLAHLNSILQKRPLKDALAQLFQTLIDTILHDVHHRGCLMTNATTELASLDPDVAVRVNTYHQRCVRCFTEAITQASHAGEISEHHDPYALALFLMNTMDGLRVMAKRTTERKTLETIAETALSIAD